MTHRMLLPLVFVALLTTGCVSLPGARDSFARPYADNRNYGYGGAGVNRPYYGSSPYYVPYGSSYVPHGSSSVPHGSSHSNQGFRSHHRRRHH